MSEKPEALRLAENLMNQWYGLMASDSGLPGVSPVIVGALRLDAAAELRNLHAENERLREALEHMIDVYLGQVQNDGGYTVLDSVRPLIADQTALRREDKR